MKLKLLSLAMIFSSLTPHAIAGFSDLMEDTFGAMSNVTSPSAYDSARRGNFFGGSAFIKIPEKTLYPFQIEPPSINAGCGGINLYMGSFSFANLDQYVELLKNAGAGILGYGFKMAMTGFCPTCSNVINNIEEAIREINSLSINSCEIAQGVFDADKRAAFGEKIKNVAKNVLSTEGWFEDRAEATQHESSSLQSSAAVANELEETGQLDTSIKGGMTGNVTWQAIQDSSFGNAYSNSAFGSGDNDFLETIMSMTGSVIITKDEDDEPVALPLSGNLITLEAMVYGDSEGNKYKKYNCDDIKCLKPKPDGIYIDKGLRQRVKEFYTDDDGWIMNVHRAEKWSDKAKGVLGLPTIASQLCNETIYGILNKDKNNLGAALAVVEHCSDRIGLEMAYSMINQHIKTVRQSINNLEDSAFVKASRNDALDELDKVQQTYSTEYLKLRGQSGSFDFVSVLERMLKETGSVQMPVPMSGN